MGLARTRRKELLGAPGPLRFTTTPEGLVIDVPRRAPGEHAFAFKITGRDGGVPRP